jgi:hypothetical protein
VLRRRHSFALVCAFALLLTAAPALAAQNPVVTDCNVHGQLTQHYTAGQLRNALNTMPPTVKEYTNCYDLINTALLAQVGTGSGGTAGKSSGGSFLPVWLIVVLVALILGGGGYAFLAFRRQAPGGAGPGDTPPQPPTEDATEEQQVGGPRNPGT